MKPYYQDEWITQYCNDALKVLPELESESIDLLCTDPPYGISFMGKDWDRALPDKRIWVECLRVLKNGAFAFVMSIPRADCLSRMIISLEDAGFLVNFTPIFWAYASGFPKAQNIGKAVDKRLGAERVSLGAHPNARKTLGTVQICKKDGDGQLRPIPATPQAKALDGSYGGFQPKPAVEVIIVAMKPLSEKTFVEQALKNRKGISWLDSARIPYEQDDSVIAKNPHTRTKGSEAYNTVCYGKYNPKDEFIDYTKQSGRFPANLLVSDDVLNDGRVTKSTGGKSGHTGAYSGGYKEEYYGGMKPGLGDSGSFSRYFDLDKWAQKTFPFLIVPKASKSEKNKGLSGDANPIPYSEYRENFDTTKSYVSEYPNGKPRPMNKSINNHPTVKPLKLMSYLITLGSRAGDIILDPFGGSGTTALASKLLGRHCIISEIEKKYCEIAANRCSQRVFKLNI